MATAITRPTVISRVQKKFGERLGMSLKKTDIKKELFNVRLYTEAPMEIVCHILEINEHNVAVHRVRKSGSSKMDFAYIPRKNIISIDGNIGSLGRVLVMQEQMIAEYRDVTVKVAGDTFVLVDAQKQQSVITESKDIRIEITAEADVPQKKKAAGKKEKPAKSTKVKGKKKRVTEDEDF